MRRRFPVLGTAVAAALLAVSGCGGETVASDAPATSEASSESSRQPTESPVEPSGTTETTEAPAEPDASDPPSTPAPPPTPSVKVDEAAWRAAVKGHGRWTRNWPRVRAAYIGPQGMCFDDAEELALLVDQMEDDELAVTRISFQHACPDRVPVLRSAVKKADRSG